MSFIFNSVTFANYGVEVQYDWRIAGASARSLKTLPLSGADRLYFSPNGQAQPIEIVFPVQIIAATSALLKSYIDSINAALRTTAPAALSFTTWQAARTWLAMWDQVPLSYEILNDCVVATTIKFIANPYMTSTTLASSNANVTADPTEIWVPGPTSGDGTVEGNALCLPTYILRNTGGAIAADDLEIWNYHTGDLVRWNDTLDDETYLRFNCLTGVVETSPDGSTYTEQVGKLIGSSEFLPLQGGIANKLIVIGCAGGNLAWTYYGRYY
jgi:hypothetical protein